MLSPPATHQQVSLSSWAPFFCLRADLSNVLQLLLLHQRLTVSMPNLGFPADLPEFCLHISPWTLTLPCFCFLMTAGVSLFASVKVASSPREVLCHSPLLHQIVLFFWNVFFAKGSPFVNLSTSRSRSSWYTAKVTWCSTVSTGESFKANWNVISDDLNPLCFCKFMNIFTHLCCSGDSTCVHHKDLLLPSEKWGFPRSCVAPMVGATDHFIANWNVFLLPNHKFGSLQCSLLLTWKSCSINLFLRVGSTIDTRFLTFASFLRLVFILATLSLTMAKTTGDQKPKANDHQPSQCALACGVKNQQQL